MERSHLERHGDAASLTPASSWYCLSCLWALGSLVTKVKTGLDLLQVKTGLDHLKVLSSLNTLYNCKSY